MKATAISLRRLVFGSAAFAIGAAVAIPALAGHVSAQAVVTARKVTMSSSVVSNAATTYKVEFTPGTNSATIGTIIVDFCADSPIVGTTTCTYPAGLNLGNTPANTAVTGVSGTWTAAYFAGGGGGNFQGVKITSTGATQSTGTPIVVTMQGITNPSTVNTSFYARIITLGTSGDAASYTTTGTARADFTGITGEVDYGGVALSTAAQLTVTAKVQESLTFCVYTLANCGAGGNAVNLGTSGVLAVNTTTYTDTTAKFDLGSNAQSGVVVRMKGDTLKTGSFDIASTGACAVDSTTSTVERFGLRVVPGSANTVAAAPYDCASGSHGFDTATACGGSNDGNVTCTYGDQIASQTTARAPEASTLDFAAKAATTTEPGVYTANLAFIATGTY